MTSVCRSCGAPIRWVRTELGKAMPMDVEPVANGNIGYIGNDLVMVLKPGRELPPGMPRYVSHFATCPNYRRKTVP